MLKMRTEWLEEQRTNGMPTTNVTSQSIFWSTGLKSNHILEHSYNTKELDFFLGTSSCKHLTSGKIIARTIHHLWLYFAMKKTRKNSKTLWIYEILFVKLMISWFVRWPPTYADYPDYSQSMNKRLTLYVK